MSDVWPPTPDFWTGEFPARTSGRTSPYLFKRIIPATAANPDDVLAGLATMRRAHAVGAPSAAKARVYVGEDRHDELVETVLTKDGWDEGAFVEWMQSLIGADRFSLVINQLETVSPQLAAGLGAFLRSLYEGWGVPIGGAEQAAFCGNYAGTAFGVHEGAEDAFLCHLGPGTKHFYCWDPQVYAELTGGHEPTFGDYEQLLEHGTCFVMEPGDALFLPKRVFHVGRQDTFSISVAIPLYTYPDDRLLRLSVLPELLDDVLGENPDDPFGVQSPMHAAANGNIDAVQRLIERARTALTAVGDRLEAGVGRKVGRRWAAVWSNGGWEPVDDDLARTEAAAVFEADRVRPGATMSLLAPYQLRITGAEEAFLRGIDITCDTRPLTDDLVSALNAGAPVTLPHDDALCTTVAALGASGGIRITADSTTEASA
ncbi:cupin domain-containing protein (plasmid) [Streptomyces sp. R39]|uniref:Cupin domain-containing protein n=1 Tax=Streptomyces sp. R39 TaxID=3238631 RepID=A0AB39R6M4_9ACTN